MVRVRGAAPFDASATDHRNIEPGWSTAIKFLLKNLNSDLEVHGRVFVS